MLDSGDWVTARLDGVAYLEKAPLIYWGIAGCYKILGVHDWVARIPVVFSSVLLSLLSALFGAWAFGRRAGILAGLCISTCVGLFLFTRIQIPDVMLTATTALALWAFLRVLDDSELHPCLWAVTMAVCMGNWPVTKELGGDVVPGSDGTNLPGCHAPFVECANLAASSTVQWIADHPGGGCAVAYSGGDPKSTALGFHDA